MITAEYCCFDASAFSLGFAFAHKDTLILEKSENALSDYVNAVIPCIISAPVTDKGAAFAGFLKKSGCVSENGRLDSPSLAPAAAEFARNLNIILGAAIVSYEKTDSGYKMLVHTSSGLETFFCGDIVSRPKKNGSVKYLNCVVSGTDGKTLKKAEAAGAIINESFEKDEFIVSMPFGYGCTLNEARISFVRKMKECFGTSVPIDAFASDFAYGTACGDIIKDFEAGVEFDLP